MLLQATTGQENFATSGSKAYVFMMPPPSHVGVREVPILMAHQHAWTGVRQVGRSVQTPAAPGYDLDFGKWTTNTYDVPEGTLFKVVGSRKTSAQVAGRHASAQLLCRARQSGPLYRVAVVLTMDQRASLQRATIEGRFDVLGMEDVMRHIPMSFWSAFREDRRPGCMEVLQLEPEVSRLPEVTHVTNTSGQVVEVVQPRRRRALDL